MSEIDYKKLWEDVKGYASLQLSYGKLTAVEKLSVLLSTVAVALILLVIASFVLFNLAMSAVLLLGDLLGKVWVAYLIVAVLLTIGFIVVVVMRKQWIINPVTRFITRLFLTPDDDK